MSTVSELRPKKVEIEVDEDKAAMLETLGDVRREIEDGETVGYAIARLGEDGGIETCWWFSDGFNRVSIAAIIIKIGHDMLGGDDEGDEE